MSWKYVSLFPKDDTEESKKTRDTLMSKVLEMASIKQKI